MRANAMENLLKLMINSKDDPVVIKNLICKAAILLDRSSDNSSVLKELLNGHH